MSEGKILEEKTCSKCKKVFPNTGEYFYKRSRTNYSKTDPFRLTCKTCHGQEVVDYRKDRCKFCEKPLKGAQRRNYCSTRCKVLHKMGGIGATYGRYTIIDYAEPSAHGTSHVLCQCECGNVRRVGIHPLKKGLSQSCGCWNQDRLAKQRGESHPNWSGGRITNNRGYVLLKKTGHPNAYPDGYVLEHVYVMSEFLGRPLREGESVHHRNGLKNDNRLINLELWRQHQPYGQRIEDLVAHAKYILQLYGEEAQKLQRLHEPADPRQPTLFA